MLKFIGRGSAFNTREGNTSAYFIRGQRLILIDCGETTFDRIVRRSNILDGIKIVDVLITHMHSDHIGSLSSFIYHCNYILHIVPIIHYPTNEVAQMLYSMGHTNEFVYKKESTGSFNIAGDISAMFVTVSHVKTMTSYGLCMKIEGKDIYYSGDSNRIPNQIITMIGNIDYIYQDTCLAEYPDNVHLSLSALCESVPRWARNKVYCMHIDSFDLIEKARFIGFNVVKNELS